MKLVPFVLAAVLLTATPALAADPLISTGKPATASSTSTTGGCSAGCQPAKALDQNTTTRWSSNFSDPQWIYVDLGASYHISRVRLSWEAAYGKGYRIEVSNNASTWTAAYTTTTGDGGIDDLTVSADGRYVRVYGTARGTAWGYSLWELEVYGAQAPAPDQLQYSTATNHSGYSDLQGKALQPNTNYCVNLKDPKTGPVNFYLDGSTTSFHTENSSPWDFFGTEDATGLCKVGTFTSGSHTIKATYSGGSAQDSFTVASGPAPPPDPGSGGTTPPPAPGTWHPTFVDDFTSVDTTKWGFLFWWNGDTFWPNKELEVYHSNRCTSDGSALSETAVKESGTVTASNGMTSNSDGEPYQYTSCWMSTGGSQGTPAHYLYTYGYAEARIWASGGKGVWPGFWMQRRDGVNGGFVDDTEIDILELIGSRPSEANMTFHGPSGTSGSVYTCACNLTAGYHTYGIDWEPGSLVWYVDGVARKTLNRSDVPTTPHYLMLNLAVGGANSWPGAPDASTPFPSVTKVDWVHVWQH